MDKLILYWYQFMKLSRQEEIAILFVSSIAVKPDSYVSLSEIASDHHISYLFLKKIARLLKLHDIVGSKEGVDGGYILLKNPKDIRVIDIISAVQSNQEKHTTHELTGHVRKCPLYPSCLPQRINVLIAEAMRQYLSDLTVDQFIPKTKAL